MAEDELPTYCTAEEKEYKYRPIQGKALRFRIKAAHDCHLSFSPVGEDSDDIFEVFIGGWNGEASAIRFKKGDDIAKVDTPEILNGDELLGFYVTFDDNYVKVGREGSPIAFMEAELPEPIEVAFYGYSTGYGAEGLWQFVNERVLSTEDCLTYNFEPVYGTSVTFSVSCAHDAHIALTTGPEITDQMYEVFVGGWKNEKSAIRLNNDRDQTVAVVDTPSVVCCDEPRSFYVTFKNGHIKLFQLGSSEPVLEYVHSEPYQITHYGYCTGWGATGKWQLEI